MKITAEFNSNEELLSFISTFGDKTITPLQEFKNQKVERITPKQQEKKVVTKPADKPKQQEKKTAPKPVEKVEDKPKTVEPAKEEVTEQPKESEKSEVTKEMVRAVFTKLVKAGKAKEAKDLTQKYGANRIPDIKENDYEAIYKEAEGLI